MYFDVAFSRMYLFVDGKPQHVLANICYCEGYSRRLSVLLGAAW